jgi:hypothetical protein
VPAATAAVAVAVRPGRPTDFVFRAPGGATLRVSNFRRNVWLPAVRAANLDGLRIHDLRHTAVAQWIAAGASPKEVAQRAGHTSVSFVLDRYGHLFPEADTALRARPDDLFRAVTEHGQFGDGNGTLGLIRFGCRDLLVCWCSGGRTRTYNLGLNRAGTGGCACSKVL